MNGSSKRFQNKNVRDTMHFLLSGICFDPIWISFGWGFLTTPTIFAPNLLVRRRSLNSEIICFFILFSITLTHTICSPYWNSIHFRSTKLMLHLQSRSFTSIHIFLINFFVCLSFIKRLECSTLKSTFYRRIK